MGLVLTLREGDSFWLDDRELRVEQVFDDRNALLVDVKTGDRFEVTDDRAAEIGPDVMAHVAVQPMVVGISIDAPPEVKILRDDLKRRGQKPKFSAHKRSRRREQADLHETYESDAGRYRKSKKKKTRK